MKILVVVDMQVDFVNGALGTKEAEGIVSNVEKRVKKAEDNNEYVIFTRDTHYDNYLNTQEGKKLPVKHCIKDTDGWQIIKELQPLAVDRTIIDKPTFGSTELSNALTGLAEQNEIESITLIGLCTDICVISNAMIAKATLPEVPIIVEKSCCAGVTVDTHNQALEAMKMCQIEVVD